MATSAPVDTGSRRNLQFHSGPVFSYEPPYINKTLKLVMNLDKGVRSPCARQGGGRYFTPCHIWPVGFKVILGDFLTTMRFTWAKMLKQRRCGWDIENWEQIAFSGKKKTNKLAKPGQTSPKSGLWTSPVVDWGVSIVISIIITIITSSIKK